MIRSLLVVLIAAFTLNLSVMDLAEAKRMGSGGSFGSKFSQSNSVSKSPNTAQRESAAPSAAQSPAQATNQTRKEQLASKGGLMGLLGGLALGGLLGALFFGGAFEGINFMDILLFAGIAFLIYKFFFAKRKAQDQLSPAMAGAGQYREQHSDIGGGAAPTTPSSAPAYTPSSGNASLDDLRREIPKNFDKDGFLNGAKTCYVRLQKAWDDGDLADIRQFTTDSVFAEVQDQHRAKTEASNTQVLQLAAELLHVNELGSKTEAAVLFEAHLNEDGEETHIAEVWHFTKPSGSLSPTWFVDGIQQVEE